MLKNKNGYPGLFYALVKYYYYCSCLIAIIIVIVPPLLKTGFLPDMDEGSIVLDYTSPPGTSLEETDRMLRRLKRSLLKNLMLKPIRAVQARKWAFLLPNPIPAITLSSLKKDHKQTTEEVIATCA
jgi:multidrug efflux pump subunit AcrB